MNNRPSSWFSPVAVLGPIFLAVLANSGQIKYLGWLPGDATVLATAAVAACCVAALFAKPWIDTRVWWPVGMWMLFLLPVFTMASTAYGLQKSFTLLTITLACVVAPVFLLRTEQQRKVFLGALVALAVVFAAISWQDGILESTYGAGGELAPGADTMNPLSFARVVAPGVVIMIAYGLTRGRPAGVRLAWLGLAALMIVLLFATGRRGPIVSIVVSAFIVLLFAPAFKKYRGRSMVLVGLSFAGALWAVLRTDNLGAQRVLGFLAGEADASTRAREHIWSEAGDLAATHPFGIGWGQFPPMSELGTMTTDSGRMYPHNIFLEVFLEAGWFTGVVFTVFLVVACVRSVRAATTPTMVAFLGLLVSGLANAMVSGDLNDQKLMWVAVGVAFITKLAPAERHPLGVPPALPTSQPIHSRRLMRTP